MSTSETTLKVSHLTLAPSNIVTHSIVGYFSQTKYEEILCVRGNGQWLQLHRLISSSLHQICLANTFGQIRTINKISFNNPQYIDFIAITTDAGKLIILQFDKKIKSQNEMKCFKIITKYQISKKNGCLKNEVGQYCKCIKLPQNNNQYLFFISATLSKHLWLRLTITPDGRHIEWTECDTKSEPNYVVFDTSYMYLYDNITKKELLYCVSLECGLCTNDNKDNDDKDDDDDIVILNNNTNKENTQNVNNNNNNEPALKKRKLNKKALKSNYVSMIKLLKCYSINYSNQCNVNNVCLISSIPLTSYSLVSIPLNIKYQQFGGIIVCSANNISYYKLNLINKYQEIHCLLPKRVLQQDVVDAKDNNDNKYVNPFDIQPQDIMIHTHCAYCNNREIFYVLLQSDLGDIYKLNLLSQNVSVKYEGMEISVLDSMPVACTLSIFPLSHYIYIGSENNNNYLCKIKSIAINNNNLVVNNSSNNRQLYFEATFNKYFQWIQEYDTLNNCINIKVTDLLNEDKPQIYALCGRGQQSSLKILRYGIPITPLGKLNVSPHQITQIWTISNRFTDNSNNNNNYLLQPTHLICVSSSKGVSQASTLLFTVKNNGKEINDIQRTNLFIHNENTIHFDKLWIETKQNNNNNNNNNSNTTSNNIFGINSNTTLIQTTSSRIRCISCPSGSYSSYDWNAPQQREITHCTSSLCIIAIVLNSQFIELLKPKGGKLQMVGQKKEVNSQIIDISFMLSHNNNNYKKFPEILAVATANQRISIYNINDRSGLIKINEFSMADKHVDDKITSILCHKFSFGSGSGSNGYIFVGTSNGQLYRFSLSSIFIKKYNPNIISTKYSEFSKNLGSKPVKLVSLNIGFNKSTVNIKNYQHCVMAISSQNHIITEYDNNFNYKILNEEQDVKDNNDAADDILASNNCYPLLYSYSHVTDNYQLQQQLSHYNAYKGHNSVMFDDCSSFIITANNNNNDIVSTFITVSSECIQIYGIESSDIFEFSKINLRYTPRDMVIYDDRQFGKIFIIESDYREYLQQKRKQLIKSTGNTNEDIQRVIGYPRPTAPGQWASCFRMFDPKNPSSSWVQFFNKNEAAFCISICQLVYGSGLVNEDFLIIGTGINMIPHNISASKKGRIHIFKFQQITNTRMEPKRIAIQSINGLPQSIISYRGGIMVAHSKSVSFYKLIKTTDNNNNNNDEWNLINDARFNIFINSQIKNGSFYINKIYLIEDCELFVDKQTNNDNEMYPHLFLCDNVSGFHLFLYNFNKKRFDYLISQSYPHHPLSSTSLDSSTFAISSIFGNFYISRFFNEKFQDLIGFNVADTITSIEKCRLSPTGKQIILYATITGTIACFIPFKNDYDAQFGDAIQYYLTDKLKCISNQSNMLFRSKYMPSKNCDDWDFCKNFKLMKKNKRKMFQKAMKITEPKISKNISNRLNGV